jgi:propane monooxygenase reductase subunit
MPSGLVPEAGNVTDVVARREATLARCEVYLCGPPPMVDAALAFLDGQGVPKDQVFYDSFTSPVSA